jgi:O-antigen/teichoic acid export membrane protein
MNISQSSAIGAWTERVISLIRIKPFDTSTVDGRSSERYRRIAWAALASAAARSVSIITTLVAVPLTVNYLGLERYGLWMTMSSLIAMLGFADLGIGNGLINAVSEANGKDDREMAQNYVSSSFFVLTGVAVALGVLFTFVYPHVPWRRVFNISSPLAISEAGPATAIFVGCFLASIPLSLVTKVQMGYQEGFASNVWTASGQLLGLCSVLLVIHHHAGLPWLILAMAGSPVVTLLINSVVVFGIQRPWLLPQRRNVTKDSIRGILCPGMYFFVLQIAMSSAWLSDSLIVAHMLGSAAVTQYSVPMKLFSIPPSILMMVLAPLWPAYGEAVARHDIAWVKSTLVRSLCVTAVIMGITSTFLVVFGAPIIKLWAGPQITPTLPLLVGLGLWMVLFAEGNAIAMFLNGISALRFQAMIAVAMAFSSLILSLLLVPAIGVAGVVWGTIIAYVLFVVIPMTFFISRRLALMESRTATTPEAEHSGKVWMKHDESGSSSGLPA